MRFATRREQSGHQFHSHITKVSARRSDWLAVPYSLRRLFDIRTMSLSDMSRIAKQECFGEVSLLGSRMIGTKLMSWEHVGRQRFSLVPMICWVQNETTLRSHVKTEIEFMILPYTCSYKKPRVCIQVQILYTWEVQIVLASKLCRGVYIEITPVAGTHFTVGSHRSLLNKFVLLSWKKASTPRNATLRWSSFEKTFYWILLDYDLTRNAQPIFLYVDAFQRRRKTSNVAGLK